MALREGLVGLEELRGDLKGKHSIRINDKWRIVFRWTNDGPEGVEIDDYIKQGAGDPAPTASRNIERFDVQTKEGRTWQRNSLRFTPAKSFGRNS
jgi:hypothetical protein